MSAAMYDEELDEWKCVNGKRLTFVYERKRNRKMGIKRAYRCTECQGCPFQETCAKKKDNQDHRGFNGKPTTAAGS